MNQIIAAFFLALAVVVYGQYDCTDLLPQCKKLRKEQACTQIPALCPDTCDLCECNDMKPEFCQLVIPQDVAYCNTLDGSLNCMKTCGKCSERKRGTEDSLMALIK